MKPTSTPVDHKDPFTKRFDALSPYLNWGIKGIISCLVLGFVGWKLYAERDLLIDSMFAIQPSALGWILLCVGLLFFNILLEAAKWQIMIRLLYPDLKLIHAIRAVLVGISMGIFTPARIGEYAGRLWVIPEGKRLEAGAYTFLSKISQMAITLVMGMCALEYLDAYYHQEILDILPVSDWLWSAWRSIAAASVIVLWGLLLIPDRFKGKLQGMPVRKAWIQRLISAIQDVPQKYIRQVLGLSFVRFCVFSAQYICLLRGFGDNSSLILVFALITLVFWINSVIPSFALVEIGIRESIAIVVMGGMSVATFAVISSTFLLYLINILIPGLLGVWVLYRIRKWK